MANVQTPRQSAPGARGEAEPSTRDLRKLRQRDNPQEDWGDPAEAETQHGANHTVRPDRTEAERGQGRKTRQATKDIISRRLG